MPTKYKHAYAAQAEAVATLGATDLEMSRVFGVNLATFNLWRIKHEKFAKAICAGKEALDARVERSMFQRAVGYSFDAVKIFMPAGAQEPVIVDYVEHVPPDPGAAKHWLSNRQPDRWREKQHLEHTGAGGGPIKAQVTYDVVAAPKFENDEQPEVAPLGEA